MTDTKHKAIKVRHCDPGEVCEGPSETDWPSRCDRLPAIYTIEGGSGYVVACRRHAQELVDERVEDGDIYQEPPSE